MTENVIVSCVNENCTDIAGIIIYQNKNRLLMRMDHMEQVYMDLRIGLPLTNQLKQAQNNAYCLLCAKNILQDLYSLYKPSEVEHG